MHGSIGLDSRTMFAAGICIIKILLKDCIRSGARSKRSTFCDSYAGILPSALEACWKPVMDTPGCALSIYMSSVDDNVTGLDRKCCGALLRLNHDCFKRMFAPPGLSVAPLSPYSREFGEKAVGYCASKRNKGMVSFLFL